MRSSIVILSVLLATGGSVFAAESPNADFNWLQWRHLPVQDGGRQKPLDTLTRETAQKMGSATTVVEPHSGRELEATVAYLTMLFEWQGWGTPSELRKPNMSPYLGSHGSDKWDRADLLFVGRSTIREVLGMPEGSKYISPDKLRETRLPDRRTGRNVPFSYWAQQIYNDKEDGEYGDFDKREAMELAGRLHSFEENRMGRRLKVIPLKDNEDLAWMSLADLMSGAGVGAADKDSMADFQAAQLLFLAARRAYLDGQADAFNVASEEFIATLEKLGPTQGEYPVLSTVSLEVDYNHWAPFRLAWIFSLIAAVVMIVHVVSGWKAPYFAGLAALAACVAAMVIGLVVRWMIKESPPVTNLYESVVFAGFGTVLFGAAFGLRPGRQGILAAAMVISTMILALADNCPGVLNPSIKPLPPVLRSNFWLAIHVMTIMLSYSAFALAVGIGNVTLGFYLFGSKNELAIKTQARYTYKSLQAGTFLLLVGTLLGAAWADYSWGRFWGWDPKEVWALITLLGYMAILHARSAGIIGNRGMTALTVACFAFVLFAWYGVNFLGTGKHNYGLSGGAGPRYVVSAILLQFLYIIAAVVMSIVWSQSSVRRAD